VREGNNYNLYRIDYLDSVNN